MPYAHAGGAGCLQAAGVALAAISHTRRAAKIPARPRRWLESRKRVERYDAICSFYGAAIKPSPLRRPGLYGLLVEPTAEETNRAILEAHAREKMIATS